VSRYQKGKTNLDLLNGSWGPLRSGISGSGISWAICKSASRSRQITMPAPLVPPLLSLLQARFTSCHLTNHIETLKAKFKTLLLTINYHTNGQVLEAEISARTEVKTTGKRTLKVFSMTKQRFGLMTTTVFYDKPD